MNAPEQLIKLLTYASIFSPIMPLVISLVHKGYSVNPFSKPIIILIAFSFISDFTSLILAINGIGNYLVINIYYVFEILLTATFFYFAFKKRLVVVGIYAILLISFVGYLTLNGVNGYQHEIIPVINLSSIFLSILILLEMFNNGEEIFIDRNPLFWFTIGLLVYFSGSLFTDVLSKQILTGPLTWAFHNIANILKNILFAIGLWKVRAAT